MKGSMGLVLAILAFAVVTSADGIATVNGESAARTENLFSLQAECADASQGTYRLDEREVAARYEGRNFVAADYFERLNADIFLFEFVDWSQLADDSAELEFLGRRIDGLAGAHDEWRVRLAGVEHPDPFPRALGVEAASEPETLLLMVMGLALLAIWRERRVWHMRA